ncbi:hypothetical protein [Anatilimnocola floriformis]|uniref:hypothetical protein n=1 Tax=Anatilimnocola floriformis TaxID=2948575 RepID=UPI0020C51D1F|nr:hypothetical protein [Anatilimnocola floriformis]
MSDPFSPIDQRLKQPHEERLSIGLLLLWTAVTAALLGYDRATSQPSNGELGSFPLLMAFVVSPLVAVGLSAWVLMLWRWYTEGPPFPSQPGHWLLLAFGFTSVATLLMRMMTFISLTGLPGSSFYVGVNFVALAFAMILNIAASIATRDRWRILFAIGVAANALAIFMMLLLRLDFQFLVAVNLLRQLLGWGYGLALLVLAVADLRQGVRRDNVHWIGVIVVAGYLIYTTALPFLIRFVQ